MSIASTFHPAMELTRQEGYAFLSAPEAILKGALETDLAVSLVTGPRSGPFARLFRLGRRDDVAAVLRRHGTRLAAFADSRRAVSLAWSAARAGQLAVTLVPWEQLDRVQADLPRLAEVTLDEGGAAAVIIEDRPTERGSASPRLAGMRAGLVAFEPADVEGLRDGVDHALRLSRAGQQPVIVVAHTRLLRSAETMPVHLNRVPDPLEVTATGRRRRHRISESGGVLRVARRLEMNRFKNMPSPGERVPVGFIVVGLAAATLRHLMDVLGLVGRVPVLELGLLRPLDQAAVGRFLTRCEHVVVLESRPGELESAVLVVAEEVRRTGEVPAGIWGRTLPPDPSGAVFRLGPDDAVHPSVLVRRIVHLLHQIRPTLQVASRLLPSSEGPDVPVPPRVARVGMRAALETVRELLREVDQVLAESVPESEDEPRRRLMLAGQGPEEAGELLVPVELWGHRRFVEQGLSALVQAAREERPLLFIVCEQSAEEIGDLERLARSVIPAERATRAKVLVGNLADRRALSDLLLESARLDRLSVVVVRDGPPARYDVTTIERALAEIDRLGFEPRQTMTRPADLACGIRAPAEPGGGETRPRSAGERLETQFSVRRWSRPGSPRPRLLVRPLLEQVVVVRVRPPAWVDQSSQRLPTPRPLHHRQPQWRAHVAGLRGEAPGPAARALCLAGARMGYAVKCTDDPTPIGPGRRAWAQVLFTRPRKGEHPTPLTGVTPYGEADLLLGLSAEESLWAMGPDPELRVTFADRTFAVVNTGPFDKDREATVGPTDQEDASIRSLAMLQRTPRLVQDVAGACRAWLLTDRVTDLVLLGAAFQLGLVPVTPEAIEAALHEVEAAGFGRCNEAFRFGRRLAVDPRLLVRPRPEREDPVERLGRRMALSLRAGSRRSIARSERFAGQLRRSLAAMPGLTETDRGRNARRDLVHGLYRCCLWGGADYAQEFADRVVSLYRVDRGDTGRALTRDAILPLAEAMLPRGLVYVASMAMSAEQRRQTRRRLNVRHARGDRIERRFLTRIDAVAFGRRMRLDLRTSDWPARLLAGLGRILPLSWRGSRAQRAQRAELLGLVARASEHAPEDYEGWNEIFRRLYELAETGQLGALSAEELHALGERVPSAQPAAPDPAPADGEAVHPRPSATTDDARVEPGTMGAQPVGPGRDGADS